MGRIRNTMELAKSSWAVLKQDRELLWFPVMSFLVSVGVIVVIAIPIIAMIDLDTAPGEETSVSPAVYVLGLLAAFALSIVSVFFNGALGRRCVRAIQRRRSNGQERDRTRLLADIRPGSMGSAHRHCRPRTASSA